MKCRERCVVKKVVVKVQPKKSKVGPNERDEQDCSITVIEEKE